MGYWSQSKTDSSFGKGGGTWGDQPADELDHYLKQIKAYVKEHKLQAPTKRMILAVGTEIININARARQSKAFPRRRWAIATEGWKRILADGIQSALESFTQGLGRLPTAVEQIGGLRFSLGMGR